jgi:hypothetical protein
LESKKNKEDYNFYFILFFGEISTRNDRHHRHFAFDLLCKIDRVCGGRCGLSLHARVGGSTEWDGPANTSRGVYYTTTCVVCVWGRSSFHLDGQTKKKKKRFSIF